MSCWQLGMTITFHLLKQNMKSIWVARLNHFISISSIKKKEKFMGFLVLDNSSFRSMCYFKVVVVSTISRQLQPLRIRLGCSTQVSTKQGFQVPFISNHKSHIQATSPSHEKVHLLTRIKQMVSLFEFECKILFPIELVVYSIYSN